MRLKFNVVANLNDINDSDLSNQDFTKLMLFVVGNMKELGDSNLKRAVEIDLAKVRGLSNIEWEKSIELDLADLLGNAIEMTSGCNNSIGSSTCSSTCSSNCSTTSEESSASDVTRTSETCESGKKKLTYYYKYFLAVKRTVDTSNGVAEQNSVAETEENLVEKFFLSQIEANWRELVIPSGAECVDELEVNDNLFERNSIAVASNDSYHGFTNGWLLGGQNEVQFHFYDNPLEIKSKYIMKANLIITKVDIEPSSTSPSNEIDDFIITQSSFNRTSISNSRADTFNAFNKPDVYTNLRIRTNEKPRHLTFELKLYRKCLEIDRENGCTDEEIFFASSYFKMTKALLEHSVEEFELPVLDIKTNRIIGYLKTEILLITGTQENYELTVDHSYSVNQSTLIIGHRGMGKTFDAPLLSSITAVENTVESFSEAFKNGAKMVEFDVVLTKDKIPVIYHDFSFCIKNLNQQAISNFIDIPAIHLTYDEIKKNKIYSHKILKELVKANNTVLNDQLFSSNLMFPTLEEMFRELDPSLGFDVEIKYPLDLEDGTNEADSHLKWPNRNEYANIILGELYRCVAKYGNKRLIILTTFDPNLCSMLRIKQNKFPVLFLTNGVTNKYAPFKDLRTRNVSVSYNFAKSENFQGFVPHAEELVKDLNLLDKISKEKSMNKFLSISWGDDLNNLDNRQLLLNNGIHGIIYDRVNESASHPNLPSIDLDLSSMSSSSSLFSASPLKAESEKVESE